MSEGAIWAGDSEVETVVASDSWLAQDDIEMQSVEVSDDELLDEGDDCCSVPGSMTESIRTTDER